VEEEIKDYVQIYNATMDSVNLLNGDISDAESDEQRQEIIEANVLHLKLVLEREDWPEEFDLTPIHAAIAANES
jgi:flagellar capping protein FliD